MITGLVTQFRLALLLGVMLALLRLASCHYLELADQRAVDYRVLQRGVQSASSDVVIVAIDNASLEQLGRWPWSRSTIAKLLDQLTAARPAVVGFDIVQSEATELHGLETLREQLQGIDEQTWQAVMRGLSSGSAEDRALAEAVRRSGQAVLGYFFVAPQLGAVGDDARVGEGDSPAAAPTDAERISTYSIVKNSAGPKGERYLPRAINIRGNLPELSAAARGVGYFNFLTDADGSYRRVPLAILYRDQLALPLSLAMLRAYRPDVTLSIQFDEHGAVAVRFGSTVIPVGKDAQMLINYRGPGRTFRHVSAADLLAGKVAPETFQGKLVLVGVTADAVADLRAMPFDGVFPGVEIHANVLDNVLRDDFIFKPWWAVLVEVASILLVVGILGVGLHYARGVVGALIAAALFAGYLVGSQWLFVAQGLPLSLVYPLLAISITYTALVLQHYVVEAREKRRIRNALELYLSPSLAAMVSEHTEMLKLGGEKRVHTVLFSDVRGFTTISESLEPEVLVELLNAFLGEMTDIIFAHDGMLDKYIGDAIMAVWGAPLPQPDHAARACTAALSMVHRLRELEAAWRERGWPKLTIGIGLNTGPMVFGNMGSAQHLSLTVMGDNVNLGSRLEGLNKMYGSSIIVSEATLEAAGDVAVAREIDLVRVKGKRLPVRIFELLGPATERAQWQPILERFNKGIHAYRARRFSQAAASFQTVIELRPNDGPAELYLERCRTMQETPPGPEWDGVTTMETK